MAKPAFENFDEKIAESMIRANDALTGLPKYLGLRIEEMTPGRLLARMDVRKDLLTPFGNLHGGAMAALVDHALGCVAYPLMKPGQWAATTEFKLNYLAPAREGLLEAEATVASAGNRSMVVRVEVRAGDRLLCIAQGTLLVVDPKPKQ